MSDLVKRLRGPTALTCAKEDALEAADRIEKLELKEDWQRTRIQKLEKDIRYMGGKVKD